MEIKRKKKKNEIKALLATNRSYGILKIQCMPKSRPLIILQYVAKWEKSKTEGNVYPKHL